jgi:phosphoribosyl 1,2-cyclic phosphate phosphodiesterase
MQISGSFSRNYVVPHCGQSTKFNSVCYFAPITFILTCSTKFFKSYNLKSPSALKVTFLGTGTSQGVPVIACHCDVCSSTDRRDKRLRCSVLVEWDNYTIVIDTGPDFRQQMLRNKVKNLDAVVFTHEHKDHLAGLDDIRAFNFFSGRHMDIYANTFVETALKREFAYIFADDKYPGIPLVNIHSITKEPFRVLDKLFIPIEVTHYRLPVFGYRIDNFAYITDAKTIADEEIDKLKDIDVLVINALRHHVHPSHFNLEEALQFIELVKPKTAYLTHLSHQMGEHAAVETTLPPYVRIAYDGLVINV